MRVLQKIGFVLLTILSIIGLTSAQEECPASVDEAILALNDICLSVGRNQACYGNGDIVTVAQSDATIEFGVPGDTALVDDIQSMILSPFEVGFEEWGVAVLVLQADLPDTFPGQNVTMLLFGDVSIANDGGAYYFTSGIGTTACNQAPNGILIQTPEGAGEVNLTMNGINISLGSTAYLATGEDNMLTFALLEGNSTLTIDDSEVELETEQFTTVELDEEGNAIGEFTEPESLDNLDLPELPIVLLPENIEAEASDTDDETTSTSDEQIIPLSGTWSGTSGEFTFGDSCPPMFTEAMGQQNLIAFGLGSSASQELTFDGEGDFEELFNLAELDATGVDYTFEQTDPNSYLLTLSIAEDGVSVEIRYGWQIMSETLITGEINQNFNIPDFAICDITTTFDFEYTG